MQRSGPAPTSRGWASIVVLCSILFGLGSLWSFSSAVLLFKMGEGYAGAQAIIVFFLELGLCVSGIRAVSTGSSIVAGQHLRFITICSLFYMVVVIVSFLVGTITRDCRDELGYDGRLDCSNIQVAIIIGLVFVGIAALISWSCVACSRAYYNATVYDEEMAGNGVPMQAMSGAPHVIYGQPVVQAPMVMGYAPQPTIMIQQPQAQYVIPAGLQ